LSGFDAIAEIYDATRSLPGAEMQMVLDALARFLDPRWIILDAGVGTGRFAAPLRKSGFEILGLDVSTEMMRKAKEKGMRDLIRGSISELPFRDKTLDATIVAHIMHLVADWRASAMEIGRVTRKAVISPVQRTENDVIRESYRALRRELGHPPPRSRLEGGEWKLMEIVPPKEVIPIFGRTEDVRTEEDIGMYERKIWTVTWDVPEKIHREIIARLRSSYGDGVTHMRWTMQLVVWEPEELLRALSVSR
jgi:ubiquinone/menaquinone biosynthesis C-methylase UbiE